MTISRRQFASEVADAASIYAPKHVLARSSEPIRIGLPPAKDREQ